MKRAQPERQLQAAVAEYLKYALPADAWFTSIPGGEGRATRTPGYVPGAPDMLIVHRGHALFIELKSPKGAIPASQALCHMRLIDAGCGRVCVARSLNDVVAFLGPRGVPLRAKVAA